jgi:semaphorin 6
MSVAVAPVYTSFCFISAPNFVSSMTQGDFVYFFFRETAVEYINCGKVSR